MVAATSLRQHALAILLESDPQAKAQAALALPTAQAPSPHIALDCAEAIWLTDDQQARLPGRPNKPSLVSATQVPTRSPFTPEGRAALLHAICHIEFNAINLALDAVWRFANMPDAFYWDWLQVAQEEALHFNLLRSHLQSMGRDYGDW